MKRVYVRPDKTGLGIESRTSKTPLSSPWVEVTNPWARLVATERPSQIFVQGNRALLRPRGRVYVQTEDGSIVRVRHTTNALVEPWIEILDPDLASAIRMKPDRWKPERGTWVCKPCVRLSAGSQTFLADGLDRAEVMLIGGSDVPWPIEVRVNRKHGFKLQRGEILPFWSHQPGRWLVEVSDRRVCAEPDLLRLRGQVPLG